MLLRTINVIQDVSFQTRIERLLLKTNFGFGFALIVFISLL